MVPPPSPARVHPSRWTVRLGLSLLAALITWSALAAVTPGYEADIAGHKIWAGWLSERGVESGYALDMPNRRTDYPPGNLYLFAAVGRLYRALVDPTFDTDRALDSQLLTWFIKLPPILFHLATGGVVFLLVRRRHAERLAWLAATILLFDPAAIYDVAYLGQYDPVHTLFSLVAIGALSANHPGWAGGAIGLAALTKPQSWILLPLVAAMSWRKGGAPWLVRLALGVGVATLLGIAPFIIHGRLGELARLPEYMNTKSLANHVISANAHNLWWIPTLIRGRWIDDSERLLGPLAYRWVGLALVGLVLLGCLARLWRPGRLPNSYLLTAGLAAGWFFFTPRAHENHAFLVMPFLAVAWPSRPRRFWLYPLASLALLANLVLEDPALLGDLTAAMRHGTPLPTWFVVLTLADVALFGALVAGLAWTLLPAAGKRRLLPPRLASAIEPSPPDRSAGASA